MDVPGDDLPGGRVLGERLGDRAGGGDHCEREREGGAQRGEQRNPSRTRACRPAARFCATNVVGADDRSRNAVAVNVQSCRWRVR